MFLGDGVGSLGLGGGPLGIEVLEGQTNHGLLDLGSSSSSLSGVCLSLSLLVHLSPCLSPVELNRPYSLLEQRSDLVADKEVNLSVFSDVTLSSPWVHTVLSKLTDLSLDNHYINTNRGDRVGKIYVIIKRNLIDSCPKFFLALDNELRPLAHVGTIGL